MKWPVTLLAVAVALAAAGSARGQSLGSTLTLPPFSDAAGFTAPSQYQNILSADIDGDGREELVGRQHYGMEAWKFDVDRGQWVPLPGRVPLWDRNNWTDVTYAFTVRLADVQQNGKAAVMFRGAGGISFWGYDEADGDWAPQYGNPVPGTGDDAQSGTWLKPSTYATLALADLFGDHRMEIVARMSDGVHVWGYDGTSWSQVGDVLALSDAVGWLSDKNWRTIRIADFDGDGKDELMARWSEGVSIYRMDGSGHWIGTSGPALSDAAGWSQPAAYVSLRAADLDGDRRAEIYGLLPGTGVLVYKAGPNGVWQQFGQPLPLTGPGWDQSAYYATLQAADLMPEHAGQELMIRGAAGLSVYAQRPDGTWIGEVGPALTDAAGFGRPEQWITIQAAEIDGRPGMEILARDEAGMRTWRRDAATRTWGSPSSPFPDYTSAQAPAALRAAFAAVPAAINGTDRTPLIRPCRAGESPTDGCVRDLRKDFYPAHDADDLNDAYTNLKAATTPPAMTPPVDPTAWTTVRTQILLELDAAAHVTDHAANMRTFQLETVLANDIKLDDVANRMSELNADADYAAYGINVLNEIIEGLAFIAPEEIAVEIPLEEVSVVLSLVTESAEQFGLGDEIKGKLPELKAKLGDNLTTSLQGATAIKNAALGDWGLLATWSDLVTNGRYLLNPSSDAWARARAGALLSYTTWLYQTLSPNAWYIRPSTAYKSPYAFGPNSIFKRGGLRNADDEIAQVFAPTSDQCRTAFLSSCGLGVPLSDVYLHRNGWDLFCDGKIIYQPDTCPTVALSVSASAHRNGTPSDLAGKTLRAGARQYVFLGPYRSTQRRVRRVRFLLDGKTLSRSNRHPFDLVGSAPARRACPTCARRPAHPLDPGLLAPGRHRLTAIVRRKDGKIERSTAHFRVHAPRPHRLRFSEGALRGRALHGSTISRSARVFYGPPRGRIAGVRAVRFHLDGRRVRHDAEPPYALARRRLAPGPHRLKATVLFRGGRAKLVRRATFAVSR